VNDLNFDDRHFLASQAVYEQIQRGEHPDVATTLMNAHLQASNGEGDD
jgi:hypothetical protein